MERQKSAALATFGLLLLARRLAEPARQANLPGEFVVVGEAEQRDWPPIARLVEDAPSSTNGSILSSRDRYCLPSRKGDAGM